MKKYQKLFWWSCQYGHKDIVERLINSEIDIDIDKQDFHCEESGLIKACLGQNISIAELLIENGANMRLKDKKGKSCFEYLKEGKSNIYNNSIQSLRGLYLKFKNSNQNELRKITLQSLFEETNEEGFIIKTKHLVNFELIDFDKIIQDQQKDDFFITYFIGLEFNEKLICDVINFLKDFKDVLESAISTSFFDFLRNYSFDITRIRTDLRVKESRVRLNGIIESKIRLINEFQLIIESKMDSMLKFANIMSHRDEVNRIVNPLNEIDKELENCFDKELIDNYFKEKGFRLNEMINDENNLFRALSDEFFGNQKFFLVIRDKICQYLKQNSLNVLSMQSSENFQENEILNAFSRIYYCKINIHQVNKIPITIKDEIANREINILHHKRIFSGLIKTLLN